MAKDSRICPVPLGKATFFDSTPMIATGSYGRGRTAIFASDFAPHWAGDFPYWDGYATFWTQMLRWLDSDGG